MHTIRLFSLLTFSPGFPAISYELNVTSRKFFPASGSESVSVSKSLKRKTPELVLNLKIAVG